MKNKHKIQLSATLFPLKLSARMVCIQNLEPAGKVLLDLLWDLCSLVSIQVLTHLWHVSISPHVFQTTLERAKVVVNHVQLFWHLPYIYIYIYIH